MKKLITIIFALFITTACFAYSLDSFGSKPEARVIDTTKTLDGKQITQLTEQLEGLKKNEESVEGFIVLIDSLEGKSIEDYTNSLFRKWKIGNKDLNNGLLILVAKNDKKYRTEVGYGLEGVLPDGLLGTLMRYNFKSSFKKNDYYSGLSKYLIDINDKLKKGESKDSTKSNELEIAPNMILFTGMFFLIVVVFIGYLAYRTKKAKKVYEDTLKSISNSELNVYPKFENTEKVALADLLTGAAIGYGLSELGKKNSLELGKRKIEESKNRSTDSSEYGFSSMGSSNSSSSSYESSSSSSFDSGGDSGGGGSSGDW